MTLGFGLLMGVMLIGIGLAMYAWAPRVGPNPFFGVRTGYSYANREVWDQSNRVGGLAMAGVGVVVLVAAAILQVVSLPPGTGILVLTGVMLVALLGVLVWLFVYTRRLALGTTIARELAPVTVPWRVLGPVLTSWAWVALTALAVYPTLPAVLATHFDMADQPNGWTGRGAFLILYVGLTTLMTLIPVGVTWLARHEPVVALSRLGGWRIEPRDGVAASSWSMAVVNVFMWIVLLDIIWYAWYGAHLMPLGLLTLGGTSVLLGSIVAIFFHYARRAD